MSLENEYFNEKAFFENEKKALAKLEATEIKEDENNPFSLEERINAKQKGIESYKKSIKESEELIEEIQEELINFIKNGGEVSEKTKEAIGYFEPINVNFKIVSNKNDEIYVEGYVTINDEEAEDTDWYYWDGSQYRYSQRAILHDGVQITGATWEQENEIAQFEGDLADDGIWIDGAILQSNDDENRTFVRENCTIIINGDD